MLYIAPMPVVPRHRQSPVSIRSDKAAALLARLTRNGRSQAQVIEEALAKAVMDAPPLTPEAFEALIEAAVKPARGYRGPSRRAIEAEIYDENGLAR